MNEKKLDNYLDLMIDHIAFYRDIHNDFDDEYSFLNNLKELETIAKELYKLALLIKTESAKIDVAVVGNFSCGKSSFINSLIGEKICPVAVNPTTSSITKFIYSDSIEIYVRELDKVVTEKEYFDLCQHKVESMGQTKKFSFEYHYPFSEIRNIILYDTPGFKNPKNKDDDAVTLEHIKEADIVLFLLDINNGTIDKDVLEKIEKSQKKNAEQEWFFVLNKSDQKPPTARSKILKEIEYNYKLLFDRFFLYSATRITEKEFEDAKDVMYKFFQEKGLENKKIVVKALEKKDADYKVNYKKILENIKKEVSQELANVNHGNNEELSDIQKVCGNSLEKLEETHNRFKDKYIESFQKAILQNASVETHLFDSKEYFRIFNWETDDYKWLRDEHWNLTQELLNKLSGFYNADTSNKQKKIEKIIQKIDKFLGTASPVNEIKADTTKKNDSKSSENKYANSSLEEIKKYAEKGDVEAQYQLARIYLEGKGIPQNYHTAFHWFYKVAEKGHIKAQYNLGRLYAEGKGAAKNIPEAIRWFKKAAEAGLPAAYDALNKI